jgi:hypothetical protein
MARSANSNVSNEVIVQTPRRLHGARYWVREESLTAQAALDVDPGRNGGVQVPALGDVVLSRRAGDLKGYTQNGGLRIELAGDRWEGQGLDVETRNGAVRLTLPANYSTELETGTVHGRVEIDFPATIHPGRHRLFAATFGSGGPKIRTVTTNGSVTVRRE